jgi:hypothetical protein
MMRMCDGNCKRIRGVAAGNFHAGQKSRDHRMNLRLFGIADADDRFLDQACRIFANVKAGSRDGKQADATRLTQLEGRLRVGIDKNLLNRRFARPMFKHQVSKCVVQRHKAFRQRSLGIGRDLSVGYVAEPVADRRNHAPPGRAQAGVEAENDQPIFSMMSSGTS